MAVYLCSRAPSESLEQNFCGVTIQLSSREWVQKPNGTTHGFNSSFHTPSPNYSAVEKTNIMQIVVLKPQFNVLLPVYWVSHIFIMESLVASLDQPDFFLFSVYFSRGWREGYRTEGFSMQKTPCLRSGWSARFA